MVDNNFYDRETLEALHYLREENPQTSSILKKHNISIAIVLGTGLGPFIDALKGKITVSYDSIPNMPKCTIQGHSGHIVIGYFDKSDSGDSGEEDRLYCVAYAGRVHSYEGISNHEVCFQVKLSAALGCKQYILTNSTGGLQDGMYDGCLFLIKDHLRFVGRTDPLFEMRYASQWKAHQTENYWDVELQNIARNCAKKLEIELFEGTYVYASGPNYETPLEVKTAIALGGGVVGMSTVAETIAANAYGMKVLGISMVTNLGAGISTKMLTHDEVQENAALAIPRFILLLQEITREISHKESQLTHDFTPKFSEISLSKKRLNLSNFGSQIDEARKFLEAELGISQDHSSTMIISTDRSLVKELKQGPHVELKKIPNFPVVSVSGNIGFLYYGKLNESEKPYIVVAAGNREGFLEEESVFLSSLAYYWGISSLVHTVQGELLNEESSENIVVDDILNFSCSTRPLAVLKSIFERPVGNETDTLLVKSSDSSDKVYMSFQAPSSFSQQERNMARSLGASIVGKTNISPLFAFKYLGIQGHVVRTTFEGKDLPSCLSFLTGIVEDIPLDLNRPALPIRENPLEISFVPVPSERNISYEGVSSAAAFIRQTFLKDVEISGGLIDLEFNLQWPSLVVKTLPIKDIPYLSTFFKNNNLKASDLILMSVNSKFILAVSGCFDGNDPFYVSDASIFVRLFQELNIRGIIFTGTLKAADSSLSPKNVYSIGDHINFSGENPLIGRNVPEWGPRFPDATTSYSLKFDVPDDVTKVVVNALFTSTNRILRLESEKRMARNLNCQVIGNLGVRELITSVHCMNNKRILAGFLGLLEDYKNVTDANPIDSLQKIILHFWNGLA